MSSNGKLNKKKQRGFYNMGDGLGTFFLICGILCAIAGWAVIEGIIWVFSHISISWNW